MRLTFLAVLILGLKTVISLVLAFLNRKAVKAKALNPPEAAAAVMDQETYAKSVRYTLVKSYYESITDCVDAIALSVILLTGILPRIYSFVVPQALENSAFRGALFITLTGLLLSLISVPFDFYHQFKIEADFGFNTSSVKLWASDKLKGLALTLVIGIPLLTGILSLVHFVGANWWIWGFCLLFVFQLIMLVIYPILIMPLFNKLSPLPEGSLKARLFALSERTGFKAKTILVMDGSKRSAHSNAFFTGFGRFRRIVLFDTLIAQFVIVHLKTSHLFALQNRPL